MWYLYARCSLSFRSFWNCEECSLLQMGWKTLVLSVKDRTLVVVFAVMPLIMMIKSMGPRTLPCGIPLLTLSSRDAAPPTYVSCVLFFNNALSTHLVCRGFHNMTYCVNVCHAQLYHIPSQSPNIQHQLPCSPPGTPGWSYDSDRINQSYIVIVIIIIIIIVIDVFIIILDSRGIRLHTRGIRITNWRETERIMSKLEPK